MAEHLRPSDPATIGGYRLLERLGAGGMGAVYLAKTPGGRLLAIKAIHPQIASDPDFRQRFRREVAAARTVNGLYTAIVVDADPDADTPWFATAFIKGPTLAQAVETGGPLDLTALLALAGGLTEALQAIHVAGLVHRDLKPSNVLLAEDGPRVIDFGISRAWSATELTTSGMIIGTPSYMSTEQARGGSIAPASDVFSLGAVLAFAATGQGPYGYGSAEAIIYRILHAEPDLTAVPELIRPLIAACLAKDPERRPTPRQMLDRLQELNGVAAAAEPVVFASAPSPSPNQTYVVPGETGSIAVGEALAPPPQERDPTVRQKRNPTVREERKQRRRPNLAIGLAMLFNRQADPAIADGGGSSPPPPPPVSQAAMPDPPTQPPASAQIKHAAAAAPGPEPAVRIVDPESITSRTEFFTALGKVREHAALSPKDLAAASGLPTSTVRGYFERGRLPAERDVLRQILRACGVPDEELSGWDGALVRVRSQRQRVVGQRRPRDHDPGQADRRRFVFGPANDPAEDNAQPDDDASDDSDLLFRVYIPKSELYAEQRREMLRHFRVWLTTVQGQDIREEDFTARDGATVAFFVGPGQPRPPLIYEYREFVNFVEHCVHNPATALAHLTQLGIDQPTGTVVVADYAKKIHRMEMDLRHSRQNTLLVLQQALEGELLDKGGDPQGIATLQSKIRTLLEQVVPPPTAGTAMPVIRDGQPALQDTQAARDAYSAGHDLHIYVNDPAHGAFNPEKVIRAALEKIQGTANFGPEAKELLSLIVHHGDDEAMLLRSALHELEDPGIPVKTKSEAKRKLRRFLSDFASGFPAIAIGHLQRYVDGRPGLPGP